MEQIKHITRQMLIERYDTLFVFGDQLPWNNSKSTSRFTILKARRPLGNAGSRGGRCGLNKADGRGYGRHGDDDLLRRCGSARQHRSTDGLNILTIGSAGGKSTQHNRSKRHAKAH